MDSIAQCDNHCQPLPLKTLSRAWARGPLEDVPASKCGGSTKRIEKFRYVRIERKTPHLVLGHAHQTVEPGQVLQHFRDDPPREWEDVFICMNQYRGRRGADEASLSVINGVAVDLDFDKSKIGTYTVEQLLEVISDFGLPEPGFIVSTGGGFHVVWLISRRGLAARFGKLYEPSQRFVEWFKDVVQRLQNVLDPLGADSAYTRSPTQTVRLPGSWNVEAGCRVELVHANPKAVTWLEAFDDLKTVDWNRDQAQTSTNPSRHYTPAVDWANGCKAYERASSGVREGKRELASFIVAIADYNRGLSFDKALSHAHRVNHRHTPPLPDWEVKHAVLMAFKHGYRYSRRRSCEVMGIEYQPRQRKRQRQRWKAHEIIGAIIRALHKLGIYKRQIIGLAELGRHLGLSERQLRHAIQKYGLGYGIDFGIEPTAQGRATVFRIQQGQGIEEGSDNLPPESRGYRLQARDWRAWEDVESVVVTVPSGNKGLTSWTDAGSVCLDVGEEYPSRDW